MKNEGYIINKPAKKEKPFLMATVTQASPLRIRIDGDTAALPYTPTRLISSWVPAVGDRVKVSRVNGHYCVDGAVGQALTDAIGYDNFNSGWLIDTGLPTNALWQMIIVEVAGNGYGAYPINTTVQGYHYTPSGNFINCKQTNFGASIGRAKFMHHNGKIMVWIPPIAQYSTLRVKVYTNYGVLTSATITESAEPAGSYKTDCAMITDSILCSLWNGWEGGVYYAKTTNEMVYMWGAFTKTGDVAHGTHVTGVVAGYKPVAIHAFPVFKGNVSPYDCSLGFFVQSDGIMVIRGALSDTLPANTDDVSIIFHTTWLAGS